LKRIKELVNNINNNKNNIEQDKIEIIKLKKKNIQNKKEILSVLEEIGLDALKDNELINHLYWHERMSLKDLSDCIGVQNKTLGIKPMTKTICCDFCKLEYEMVKDFKHSYMRCPGCEEKRIKREEEWENRDKQHKIKEEKRRLRREELHTMPYHEYLQTPEWKETRYVAMKKANFKCQLCGDGGKLNTHHNTYKRRGYEMSSDLMVLCGNCHETYSKN